MTDVFASAFTTPMTRRTLIKRVAAAGAATWAAGTLPTLARAAGGGNFRDFTALAPSAADELQVPDGYAVDVIIKWGDEFGDGLRFGYNCDYSAWFPFAGKGDEGLIFVSHEYLVPFFTTDWVNTPANNALWDPRVEPYKTPNRPYRRGMPKSEAMQLLADGQLYVAQWLPTANDPAVDSGTGMWHPLDMSDPESCAFTTKWVEANIVPANGGDVMQFRVPRAEDCEVLPSDRRSVLIALTSARGRPADPAAYGVVRLLQEDSIHPHSTSFRWVELLEGGEHTGLASPDNMAFSSLRELWVVTDISTSSLNHPTRGFAWHMNNAIFYVPLEGRNRNVAFRFANAPVEAELTGPTFNHQQRTLFLNVQHPGENSTGDPANP
ncbi:MAG TPA: alkaline phosphatase PhoX, partial [Gaiellaceae bacterium]|nr:alkaline phosphatase PhoX [Gaiellaceae bacterium]